MREKIFARIEAEHTRTRDVILRVTGAAQIGERFAAHRARLADRLPTINEVNREQVELLRRFRSTEDESVRERIKIPLLLSISCIASGLGATG
jgi:phosphoenolpyruvate carboxylase